MEPDALARKYGRLFPAGTTLFEQGDEGREMYVISSGKIEISRHADDKEMVLAVLGPGDFFGEMAIINNQPRSATARVLEDAQVLVIDARTFEGMIRANAEVAVRMIRRLAARLDAMGKQVEVLLFRDPNSRVVHCLRQEAEQGGVPHPAGIAVEITDEQLAERAGLSLEEVEQVVAKLERARLLTRASGAVFVVAEVGQLQQFLEFLELRQRRFPR